MARGSFNNLSPDYRARLERGGIDRAAYERGEPLKTARGHARTPEHPREAITRPERYRDYTHRREQSGGGLGREDARNRALRNYDRNVEPQPGEGWQSHSRAKLSEAMDNPSKWSLTQLNYAANLSGSEWRSLARRAANAYNGHGPESDKVYGFLFYH
jgi:hypothetical protein